MGVIRLAGEVTAAVFGDTEFLPPDASICQLVPAVVKSALM